MSDQQQVGPAPQHVFAAPPHAYPPPAPYDARPPMLLRRSPVLGIIAFIAALAALLVGVVLSAWAAQLMAGILPPVVVADDGSVSDIVPDRTAPGWAAVSGASTLAVALWAVLALWGFVEGIVATALARGRGWGIAAIVFSPLSGIACVVVYSLCLVSAIAASVSSTSI